MSVLPAECGQGDWLMQAILQTKQLSLLALMYFANRILLKEKLNIFITF
jgi:hypothetical protein